MIGSGFSLGKIQRNGLRSITGTIIHIQLCPVNAVRIITLVVPVGMEPAAARNGSGYMKVDIRRLASPGKDNPVLGGSYGFGHGGRYCFVACQRNIEEVLYIILLAEVDRVISFI